MKELVAICLHSGLSTHEALTIALKLEALYKMKQQQYATNP